MRTQGKKKKSKIAIVLGILSGLFIVSVSICILLDAIGEVKSNLYGKNIATKEETFEILIENQDEFELLAENMKVILSESEKSALCLRGESEYRKNGLYSNLLKKYLIKMISISNISESMEITFNFEVESDSVRGIYYVLNDEPVFWGEKKNIKEENGIYSKQGPYYLYKTEKIIEHWYYFEVEMW